jgi:hypothetical protein
LQLGHLFHRFSTRPLRRCGVRAATGVDLLLDAAFNDQI